VTSSPEPDPSSGSALREIERRLCDDERIAELNVHLSEHGGRVFVRGDVSGDDRRDRVLALVREACPGTDVVDELVVGADGLARTPDHREEIS
jgi:hypothetical protein